METVTLFLTNCFLIVPKILQFLYWFLRIGHKSHFVTMTSCNAISILQTDGQRSGGRQTPGSSNPVMGLPSPMGERAAGNVKRVNGKM